MCFCSSFSKCAAHQVLLGAQWLSGRVLDSRPKGRGFEPHRRHYVVSLSKNIYPSLVLVQPRKTRPFITERLLMGRKESNQTKTQCFPSSFSKYFAKSAVTMYNVRNNRISDGCVYAQIRKGLGMHLVTYTNREMVPFLLLVQ